VTACTDPKLEIAASCASRSGHPDRHPGGGPLKQMILRLGQDHLGFPRRAAQARPDLLQVLLNRIARSPVAA
jgi:hypothetical protein